MVPAAIPAATVMLLALEVAAFAATAAIPAAAAKLLRSSLLALCLEVAAPTATAIPAAAKLLWSDLLGLTLEPATPSTTIELLRGSLLILETAAPSARALEGLVILALESLPVPAAAKAAAIPVAGEIL